MIDPGDRPLTLVVDAAAAFRNSVGVCVEGWLRAWPTVPEASQDRLHVVTSTSFIEDSEIRSLPNIELHAFPPGVTPRLAAQHRTVPRLARRLAADGVLATVPQVPLSNPDVPVVVVSYDFRHEVLPHEFSRTRRWVRAVEYSRAYRRADRIATISDRTRQDLSRLHPRWSDKAATVHLGGDHIPLAADVEATPTGVVALAYGHHPNKRPGLVVDAWSWAHRHGLDLPPLEIVGASEADAADLVARRDSSGLSADRVNVRGFVSNPDYAGLLRRVGVVVLVSTFEGFGLPVLEGLRLRRPVVITPEPAMVEVGGDAVTVADDDSPAAVAQAVDRALRSDSPDRRNAGVARAASFTWADAVRGLRRQFLLAAARH